MNGILIREANENDVESIWDVQRTSVVDLASRDYPGEIIEEWKAKKTPEAIQKERESIRSGRNLAWVAEFSGKVEGFSILIPGENELNGLYVTGKIAQKGAGTALLEVLEKKARELGLNKLELHSSITAKPFYEKKGYRNLGRSIHTLPSGYQMDCYVMEKNLTS